MFRSLVYNNFIFNVLFRSRDMEEKLRKLPASDEEITELKESVLAIVQVRLNPMHVRSTMQCAFCTILVPKSPSSQPQYRTRFPPIK